MSLRYRLFVVFLALGGLSLAVFQNCSNVQFASTEKANSTSGDPVTTPELPTPTATPEPPTICDPFSPGSTCAAGEGLKGSLYYLAADDTTSPRAKISDIIDNGLKAPAQIVMSQLDISTRNWSDGFPGPNGGLIMNTDGMPLVEWFALDLKGTLRLPANSDEYQFALFSDDGSILTIDDKEVIEFDGQHSPNWKCATAPVNLKAGDLHSIALRYFQGPRTQIALRLLWRPWKDASKTCDENGGFTPVPSNALFH